MPIRVLVLMTAALLAGIGCGTFPTTYDRVDDDMVRTLDFMYEPAEAGPGDSVTVTAVFAGMPLDPRSDIDWRVSWNVITNNYGIDTALDERPLTMELLPSRFSDQTNCTRFRFKIPERVIADCVMIPDNWLSALPAQVRTKLPAGADGMTKEQVLTMLDRASARVPAWSALLKGESADAAHDSLMRTDSLYVAYKQGLEPLLPMLLQLMTAEIRLFADLKVDDRHRIRSSYSVRYNSRFAAMPEAGVYANHNPRIDSIVVYTVHAEGLQYFDPAEGKYAYTATRIDSGDDESVPTIRIDKGKSYFLGGFTSRVEKAVTMDSAIGGGGPLEEQHLALWYFQVEGTAVEEVARSDYMNIVNMGSLIATIYPSRDNRVRSATIWLEVRDHMLNELFRPVGSTLAEVRLAFEYTRAWLDAARER